MAFIDFQDVFLSYDDSENYAVENIDMKIEEREFVAIVGPSGCGKSTFMKLTTGLKKASKGIVMVGGREVAGPLSITGMAFQAPTLMPWRNLLDNVLLPLEIVEPYRSNFRKDKDKNVERAMKLLKTVGLAGWENKFPWELSGGMQQRASICRALIHEPKLLMLDEPFGALDAFTREELWCVARDLHATTNVTICLVTHDLRESVFLADTVYVMSARPGRIIKKCQVNLPRPRDLEITYKPEFTDIVHELRALISHNRTAVGAH